MVLHTFRFLVVLTLTIVWSVTLKGQNKPFPQSLNYPGCIKPAVAQSTLNSDVGTYYNYWKATYLKASTVNPGRYYIAANSTGGSAEAITNSEAHGYGMVITALMAGYDANAKTYFDGLYKMYDTHRSVNNRNLMQWQVMPSEVSQNIGSATDGDMDIAYALVLAHYQWGSTGAINYLAAAKTMITSGLKASYITSALRLGLADDPTNDIYSTRPSDWMFDHMRSFKKETGDVVWDNLANNLYSVYNTIITGYSSNTGLISDFVMYNPPQPAPPGQPQADEGNTTGDYSYNACRVPLRVVMDYAHYGTPSAKTIANKIVTWIKGATSNNPANIKAGYKLNGTALSGSNYQSAVFIAPMVAAATCDASHQAFLNSGWSLIKNMKDGYFEDTYNMMCMIYISGNWWIPGAGTNPGNNPPTVTITSPANNTSYTAPASFTITATAADSDGTVAKVEFLNSTGTVLSTSTAAPYSYALSGVSAGTYTYTVRATDDKGATGTSTVTVTVTNPVVQTPYGGSAANIPGTIQAENYDLGGQNVAYNESTTANQGNAYRTTEAVDVEACTDAGAGYNVGYVTAGEWVEYTVNVTATGTYSMQVRYATMAAGKMLHVEMDGVNITGSLTLNNTGGWQTWQTLTVNNLNLTAGQKVMRVYFETADLNVNYITFSSTTQVNVPPTVSITAPSSGSSYTAPATINITANAADADGTVTQVAFYNGSTLLSTISAAPYSYSWTGVAAGAYNITAKATDDKGAVTTSATVSVVVNAVVNNVPPSVSLTAPLNGATFTAPATIGLSANAGDSDGTVTQVAFYNGSTLLGTDATSPYSYSWTNVAAGSYTLTAKATDDKGAVSTSSSISIVVNAVVSNVPPTVSLTGPANGASFVAPATIAITANAADSDGTVTQVAFYNGSTLLNTDASSPYSFSWTSVAAGSYTITAKATDDKGAVTTSAAVTITVTNPNTNTCTGIAQYVENGGYVAGSKVQNGGKIYECKPWPYSGWCNGAAWAYGPGSGTAWADAWTQIGTCSAARIAAANSTNLITLSPNPTTDVFVIEFNSLNSNVGMLTIIDGMGNTVFSSQVKSGASIDVSKISSGVYTLKLQVEDEVITQKLAKN